MPKKGARRPIAIGDKEDPDGLYVWVRRYLNALQVKNYAERTIVNEERNLVLFVEWCDARSLTLVSEFVCGSKSNMPDYSRDSGRGPVRTFPLRRRRGSRLLRDPA